MTKPTGNPKGRPKLPPEERTRSRPWAVSAELHERVEADAMSEDVTVSEWLRDAAERKLKRRKR